MTHSRWFGATLGIAILPLAIAHADPVLVLDEPTVTASPPIAYNLQVQDNGLAVVHLGWSPATSSSEQNTVDLALSTFKADGQSPVIVGFDPSKQGTAWTSSVQNVAVPRGGAAFQVVGFGLAPGTAYAGELSAIVAGRKQTWRIALTRAGVIPPFRCPAGPQIVDPDGSISAEFQRMTPPSVTAVDLQLLGFVSKEGQPGQIGFSPEGDGAGLRSELRNVALDGDRLIPPLRAIGLTEAMSYRGALRFLVGGRSILECPLDVMMPKLARPELTADRTTVVQTVTKLRPWCCDRDDDARPDASLSVRLFEKTRTQPVYGITVLQDGPMEAPGGVFELAEQASFSLNDCPVPTFTQLRPFQDRSSQRTLPPGGQLEVRMDLHGLHAGTYTFALRFTGVNAASPTPKLDVTIHVRHHWVWAVIAIGLALLASFLVTSAIVGWRERITLRGRIDQIREQSSAEHSELSVAVLLRIILDQTEAMLGHGRMFSPPDSVYDHVTQAERVASILRRHRDLAEQLEAASWPPRIKDPYRKAIGEAIRRITDPLDQSTTDAILEQLGSIKTHLAAPFGWYWTQRKDDAKLIALQMREHAAIQYPHIAELVHRLENPPANPEDEQAALFDPDIAEFDRIYWFVKLLYSRRRYAEDVEQLVELYDDNPDMDMDSLFEVADQLVWSRLALEVQAGRIRIEPADASKRQEVLRPMKFILRFDDEDLGDTYFVNNILVYEWQFTHIKWSWRRRLGDRWRKLWDRFAEPATMMPEGSSTIKVRQPRVTTYAQFPGQIEIGTTIHWRSATEYPPITIPKQPLIGVGKNTEISIIRSQTLTSTLHYFVMAAIALVTGLPTLYFANPSFGSFGDYVAVLAWAIGIDQGKNLLQLLKSFPADRTPGASPP